MGSDVDSQITTARLLDDIEPGAWVEIVLACGSTFEGELVYANSLVAVLADDDWTKRVALDGVAGVKIRRGGKPEAEG